MTNVRPRFLLRALSLWCAFVIAGCGGESASRLVTPSQPIPATMTPASALAEATLTFHLPGAGTASGSSHQRSPKWIGPTTTHMVATLVSATNLPNPNTPQAVSLNPGSGVCAAGNADAGYTCTISLALPPGSDVVELQAEDASNVVISQQIATLTIAQGVANPLTIIMDLVPAGFSQYSIGGYQSSSPSNVLLLPTCPSELLMNTQDVDGNTIQGNAGIPTTTMTANTPAIVSIIGASTTSSGQVSTDLSTTDDNVGQDASFTVVQTPASPTDGLSSRSFTLTVAVFNESGGCL